MGDDDQINYDQSEVRRLLADLVLDRGTLHWRSMPGGRGSAILMPAAAGISGPILVTVVAEEAVVQAGAGASTVLTCAQSGDEGHVASFVGAIMDGGATEFGIFDLDGLPRVDLTVVGSFGEYSFDTTEAIHIRQIPAWPMTNEGAS